MSTTQQVSADTPSRTGTVTETPDRSRGESTIPSSTESGRTPERYRPEPRKFDDKQWLRKRYWQDLKCLEEIASECGVSYETIREYMIEYGIPRRLKEYPQGTDNPIDGFRETDERSVDWTRGEST